MVLNTLNGVLEYTETYTVTRYLTSHDTFINVTDKLFVNTLLTNPFRNT